MEPRIITLIQTLPTRKVPELYDVLHSELEDLFGDCDEVLAISFTVTAK